MYIQPSCTVFRKEPLNKTTYERPENVSSSDRLLLSPSVPVSRPFRRSYITTGLKREPNGAAGFYDRNTEPLRPWTSLTRALSFVGYIKTRPASPSNSRTHHECVRRSMDSRRKGGKKKEADQIAIFFSLHRPIPRQECNPTRQFIIRG